MSSAKQDKELADLVRKTLKDVDAGLSHAEAIARLRFAARGEQS